MEAPWLSQRKAEPLSWLLFSHATSQKQVSLSCCCLPPELHGCLRLDAVTFCLSLLSPWAWIVLSTLCSHPDWPVLRILRDNRESIVPQGFWQPLIPTPRRYSWDSFTDKRRLWYPVYIRPPWDLWWFCANCFVMCKTSFALSLQRVWFGEWVFWLLKVLGFQSHHLVITPKLSIFYSLPFPVLEEEKAW